jgi:hypothetical protein
MGKGENPAAATSGSLGGKAKALKLFGKRKSDYKLAVEPRESKQKSKGMRYALGI